MTLEMVRMLIFLVVFLIAATATIEKAFEAKKKKDKIWYIGGVLIHVVSWLGAGASAAGFLSELFDERFKALFWIGGIVTSTVLIWAIEFVRWCKKNGI